MAPLPVPTSQTRYGSAPAGRGADVRSRRIRSSASSTSVSVSGRGMSTRPVDDQRDAVELLEAADVGHRLTARATRQERLEALDMPVAQRCLRVCGQRTALHAQDVAEEQLGIEAGVSEPLLRRRSVASPSADRTVGREGSAPGWRGHVSSGRERVLRGRLDLERGQAGRLVAR